MNEITVRFVHRQSRTPVLELEGVEASATVGALRELLMERLATEEACMMRVFVKWHAEVEVGGRKRLIELTDEDAEASLGSMGISHLSEVHLDGPLTGDSTEGVGQALAVLGAQIHRIAKGLAQMHLEQTRSNNAMLKTIVALLQANNGLSLLPSEAYVARLALAAEEELAYGKLMVMERAEEGYLRLFTDSAAAIKKLTIEAHRRPIPFVIDRTTPHTTFTISDDGTTATKISESWAVFRASRPLTATNDKCAFKIIVHDFFKRGFIVIGLLPKLSYSQVGWMESKGVSIGSTLGGWSMDDSGYKNGDWECAPFRFSRGDVVVFELNFAAKTLTLSCGDRKAVGSIPSIKEGDELYPAVSMCLKGQQVALVTA